MTDEQSPSDVRAFILARKKKEETELFLKSQIDFIDMLEKFEEVHPDALKIFMEESKKRGIYKGGNGGGGGNSVVGSSKGGSSG